MYIRIKTTPNSPKKSVQIVESQRYGDKVSQRIIRHVGTAMDEDELKRLRDLAEFIKSKLESERSPTVFLPEFLAEMAIEARKNYSEEKLIVDLKHLREEQRIIIGIHEIYQQIYKELGFNYSLGYPQRVMAASKKLFQIVMARIANPSSKRESVKMLERDFGIQLSLQGVYEMMDKLTDERIESIKSLSFKAAQKLFQEEINVVFYDCTTLYFESFTEDEMKEFGYSKDMKFNQSQVLLALLVTTDGLPIGYDLYPGSTFEGDTLKKAVDRLEKNYKISNLIFVADSALLSDDNLKLLEGLNKTYIVGARIKNTKKELKYQILDSSNYQSFSHTYSKSDSKETLAQFDFGKGRKLFVTYSQNRAEKDRHDREKAVLKLKAKISKSKSPKELISNYGYKKFIKIQGEASLLIDEEKMEQAALWDGLHGIITNSKTLTASNAIEHYHQLWQIEECFRISKHDLSVRPIFHWTPNRIKAHIAICYMALTCIRYLELRVKRQYKKMSPEAIRKELLHNQISILKHIKTGQRYAIPSKTTTDLKKIYQIMGLKTSEVPYKM
jgi:transposase